MFLGEEMNYYKCCTLCPRKCNINRYQELGFCKLDNNVRIALARPFFYEEPPISGTKGSGTIFFSGCNLKCIFCQNIDISKYNKGLKISIKRLAEIMLELQKRKVHNINLVTPTMYIPSIIKAIKKARKAGLTIPIIYNSSGYENVDSLKLLNGYIDVYLPDFKYYDNTLALKYSKCPNYLENAKLAIKEMYNQTGPCIFDNNGIIKKGVIIRHLVLPNHINDSKKIIDYLYNEYQDNIFLSIMNQYTPNKEVKNSDLKSKLSNSDYNKIIDYAISIGVNNAFCQIDGTVSESFIPNFNYEGVKKET